jgi:subtilisin family serine protease
VPGARDLHQADAAALRALGLGSSDAELVLACRPLFDWAELGFLAREPLEALKGAFELPRLAYTDTTVARRFTFSVDPSRLVLKHPSKRPEVVVALAAAGCPCIRRARRSGVHALFSAGEGALAAWPALKKKALHLLTPALRRDDLPGGFWYLDGKFVVAQLAEGAPSGEADRVADQLGILVFRLFRSRGLVQYLLPIRYRCPGGVARVIANLVEHPSIRFAEPSFLALDDTDAEASEVKEGAKATWHLDRIGAPRAWTRTRGSPEVVVAIVDSGIDPTHPDLAPALRRGSDGSLDFTGKAAPALTDEEGHGTFVAGLVAGQGIAGVEGVAPGCTLLPLKVPLEGGREDYPSRRDAILQAITLAGSARVILNLSWKTSSDTVVIREAIERASGAGALVVASAGNSPRGANEPHFPSDYSSVISVAALGADLRRAPYSFWGAQVDLAAPGGTPSADGAQWISSSVPGGGVGSACGTSFAAPQVAGVAALIWSLHPELDAAAVRKILEESAAPLGDPGLGRGLVRADTAVGLAPSLPVERAPEAPPATTISAPPDAWAALNALSMEELTARFGVRPLTARMVVMKRPFSARAELDFLLRIAPDDHARLAGAAPLDTESIARPTVADNPYLTLLRGLDWEQPLDEAYRRFGDYEAEQERRLEAAFTRFAGAGVGRAAKERLGALSPAQRAEIVGAPTIRHALFPERPTDLRTLLDGVDAAAFLAGLLPVAPRVLWTASGGLGVPKGARASDIPASPSRFAWPGGEGMYVAPRLPDGPILDFASREGEGRALLGRRFPYTEEEANAIAATFAQAWDEVARVPAARRLVSRVLRVLVLRRDPARPDRWGASSIESFTGQATHENVEAASAGSGSLADSLVHESIHTLIYGIETRVPFLDRTTYARGAEATSGWSGRTLHLHAFFHACFVWYGLWCFWDRVLLDGSPPPARFLRLRDEARKGFLGPTSRGEYRRLRPQLQPAAREALDTLWDELAPKRIAR